MSKGHVFLAQNSDVDYVKQAYALALTIKNHNQINQTCLITNDIVPEEYKKVFDYIVPIPWKDAAENSQWKIENRWKIIHATPFDENLVYDVDMILTETNDHWWKHLEEKDFAFTTKVKDYRSNTVTSNFYRKTFALNNLENTYTGVFYFRKVRQSYELFKWLEFITHNWKPLFKKYLSKHPQPFYSFDVSAALALKFMGYNLKKIPVLTFTHMKPNIQSWTNPPAKWTNCVGYNLTNKGLLYVGNFLQNGVFHYVEDSFLTDQIIKQLELIYEEKENCRV